VYSSQGLKGKKLKSKLEWLLVRNVVDHASVVQKNGDKMLQRHRQTLEQKWWRSLLTRETAELVIEVTQELQSWQAEGTKILNGIIIIIISLDMSRNRLKTFLFTV